MIRAFLAFLLTIDILVAKEPPRSVYASNTSLLYALYALDRDKICCLNKELDYLEFIDPKIYDLPVIGSDMGQGRIANYEHLLLLNPDLILISKTSKNLSQIAEIYDKFGTPILFLSVVNLEDQKESYRVLGEILGVKERASKFIEVIDESLSLAAKAREFVDKNPDKRSKIYLANGVDGLTTECDKGANSWIFDLVGAINPHICTIKNKTTINFEQILDYDPDIILVTDPLFYDEIFNSRVWNTLRVVREQRVYLVPYKPFSFVDRPPNFMQILGVKWLVNLLYPEIFDGDLAFDAIEFYELFLGVSLSKDEIVEILG